MIDTDNIELAKKLIKTEKKPIIIKAKNSEFNRKILEYGKFDVLLSPEEYAKKTYLKHLDSGLNHILAKIAFKNNIAIGIDLNSFRQKEKKEKTLLLTKIIQNIKICRKTKTKIIALNIKDKRDAFSLLLSLGASTIQAKEAISF